MESMPALAVLILTGEDNHFRTFRKWTGTTTELAKKLREHNSNSPDGVPMFFANCFRPREEHKSMPRFRLDPQTSSNLGTAKTT
jgi:hypothetical protein